MTAIITNINERKWGSRTMFHVYSIPLTTLVKEFELEVAYKASDYESIQLTVADVARIVT